MEAINFLPLGSVVTVKDSAKKLVIVSRGLQLRYEGENKIMDYGAVTYPEGMIGDQIVYFNNKDVEKVIFSGFEDEENTQMVEKINNIYKKII